MKPSERCWGTWTADKPIELSHLPTGFTLTPVLYSARANSASVVPPGEFVQFGRRGLNNGTITFDTCHEETSLHWDYAVSNSSTVDLCWRCVGHGEWGLRYWVNLCFSAPEGTGFRFDRDSGLLISDNVSGPKLSFMAAKKPLMATFHDDLPALLEEYAKKGYFYLGSRATEGRFAVLRFNLEEAPSMSCRVELGAENLPSKDAPLPTIQAISHDSLKQTHDDQTVSLAQAALQAIHDVVAWNHVYDPINECSYTVLTRFWNQTKFGGFGIWMNDVMYHALLWSRYDSEKARCNIDAVFTWQTEEGNFPCLVTGNDAWLDRSQPPIVSYIIWCCYANSQDKELLHWAFPRLLANYDWWWRRRTLHDTQLVAYGTSLDIGDGLYKGTKLAAKDESSMDNMAVHDPADFDSETGLIQSADVGLNSLLALDGEILAQMAAVLSLDKEAKRLELQSSRHKARVAEWLWDESRGVFANRLIDGRFVQPLAPTSFFPMAAGIASSAQVDSLITHYLLPEEKFGGYYGLPSATRDDPAYHDNVYWRGRIWAPLNFWVYEGLRRYGRTVEASTLAKNSLALFDKGWHQRHCGENYHAESGAISDQADTDTFYTWGALLPALSVKEVVDDTPWQGLSLSPSRAGRVLGPVMCAWGIIMIRNNDSQWQVTCDDRELLSGTLAGCMSHVTLNEVGFSAELEASTKEETLCVNGRRIAAAQLAQHELKIVLDTVTLPAGHSGGRVVLQFCSK